MKADSMRLLALALATTLGAAMARAEDDPLSLAMFEACQQASCDALVKHLDRPIEWRVVLDVSLGYRQEPSKTATKLSALIARLPLEVNDRVCLDSFAARYTKRNDCRAISTQSDIEILHERPGWLARSVEAARRETVKPAAGRTDIVKTLADIVGQYPVNCSATYHLLLTDGLNQPEGDRTHAPLFSSTGGAETLAQTLRKLVSNNFACGRFSRGIHLAIDQSALRAYRVPAVVRDWMEGRDSVAPSTGKTPTGAARPGISFIWIANAEPLAGFREHVQRQVGRVPGTYPCLQSTTPASLVPPLFPSALSSPSPAPECAWSLRLPGRKEQLQVRLPPTPGEQQLFIDLLAYGRAPRPASFDATLSADAGGVPNRRPIPLQETPSESGWRRERYAVGLERDGDRVNGQRLPTRLRLSGLDENREQPFLEFTLLGPDGGAELAEDLGSRGKGPAGWAFCFLLLSAGIALGVTYLRHGEDTKLSLTRSVGGQADSANPLSVNSEFETNGHRFQWASTPSRVRRPFWPPVHGNDQVSVDVVPTASLIHWVIWGGKEIVAPPKTWIRRGQVRTPVNGTLQSLDYVFATPHATWRQKEPDGSDEARLISHVDWKEAGEQNAVRLDLEIRIPRAKWRLYRLSDLLYLAAVGASIASLYQFWGPAGSAQGSSAWLIAGIWAVMVALGFLSSYAYRRSEGCVGFFYALVGASLLSWTCVVTALVVGAVLGQRGLGLALGFAFVFLLSVACLLGLPLVLVRRIEENRSLWTADLLLEAVGFVGSIVTRPWW